MNEVVTKPGGAGSIAWLDRWRQSQLKLIARATATELGRMLEAHSCSDQQLWSGAWKSRSGEITVTVFFMVA
jgi:hypothetical protein